MKSHLAALILPQFFVVDLVLADDFAASNVSLPLIGSDHVTELAPVFDFDSDCCFPSALFIEDPVTLNGGLNPSGDSTGGCRNENFMELSNTYHRLACREAFSSSFCVDVYTLYFLKDQGAFGGHRHDLQSVAIWSVDSNLRFVSVSVGEDFDTVENVDEALGFQDGHVKIVYHEEAFGSKGFRFADSDEEAEAADAFVLPNLLGYPVLNNATRSLLNSEEFVTLFPDTEFILRDSLFIPKINEIKPAGFPTFREFDGDVFLLSATPGSGSSINYSILPLLIAFFFTYNL